MSAAVMRGESELTLVMNRNNALFLSSSCEVSRSFRTPDTNSVLPNNSAATAACDCSQNGHSFR